MTVEETIRALYDLGEKNYKREVLVINGVKTCTPEKVIVLKKGKCEHKFIGKVLLCLTAAQCSDNS